MGVCFVVENWILLEVGLNIFGIIGMSRGKILGQECVLDKEDYNVDGNIDENEVCKDSEKINEVSGEKIEYLNNFFIEFENSSLKNVLL